MLLSAPIPSIAPRSHKGAWPSTLSTPGADNTIWPSWAASPAAPAALRAKSEIDFIARVGTSLRRKRNRWCGFRRSEIISHKIRFGMPAYASAGLSSSAAAIATRCAILPGSVLASISFAHTSLVMASTASYD
eukprot:jgi/Mesvir1/89/Mv24217-RA.1